MSLQRRDHCFQLMDEEPWDSERLRDLPQDTQLNAGAGTLVVYVTAELVFALLYSFHREAGMRLRGPRSPMTLGSGCLTVS